MLEKDDSVDRAQYVEVEGVSIDEEIEDNDGAIDGATTTTC